MLFESKPFAIFPPLNVFPVAKYTPDVQLHRGIHTHKYVDRIIYNNFGKNSLAQLCTCEGFSNEKKATNIC